MMVGAAYTLFRMRKGLFDGLQPRRSAISAVTADQVSKMSRTEQYMSSKTVFALIGVMFVCMIALYIYLSDQVLGGVVAAVVMLIIAFFFATVSGIPGRHDRLHEQSRVRADADDLMIAALLMVSLGVSRAGRRGGGAGRRGSGVRFFGRGRRAASGFQGRIHSGRHAAPHPDRRADRGGGGQRRDVLPAVHSASRQY